MEVLEHSALSRILHLIKGPWREESLGLKPPESSPHRGKDPWFRLVSPMQLLSTRPARSLLLFIDDLSFSSAATCLEGAC